MVTEGTHCQFQSDNFTSRQQVLSRVQHLNTRKLIYFRQIDSSDKLSTNLLGAGKSYVVYSWTNKKYLKGRGCYKLASMINVKLSISILQSYSCRLTLSIVLNEKVNISFTNTQTFDDKGKAEHQHY